MKTAINSTTWNGYAKWKGEKADWKQFVRDAAEAGYEGVELAGDLTTIGKPSEVRHFVESCGLEIAAHFATLAYEKNPANTKQFKNLVRFTHDLGINTLMVCGGFYGGGRRNTYPWDYQTFGSQLHWASEFAEKHNVHLAFHPHRGCVVETLKETRQALKHAPQAKICLDIAHLEAVGDNAETFIKSLSSKIIYTHIKDFHWKKNSFIELGKGDGQLDIPACITLLEKKKYNGWLTIELDRNWAKWDGKKVNTPLQSAIFNRKYLKKLGH